MMPTLHDHPRLRLAVLCLLYVAQGLPYGFVTVALAAHLAAHGIDFTSVGGVIAMALLPWSFKWAWGPLVDSRRLSALGRRRPWIMLAQTLMILTAVALALVPPEKVGVVGWVVLVHNLFVGLQDVAVDALAVDLLAGPERERASGMMYGASYVGTFLGGAGLGLVTARMGLGTAILILGTAQAVILAVVIACRERPDDRFLAVWAGPMSLPAATVTTWGVIGMARALATAMGSRRALPATAAAFLMKLLPSLLSTLMTVHLVSHRQWTEERFTSVTGGLGVLLGFAASVGGGWIASRMSPGRTAIAANAALGACWIALAAASASWDRSGPVVAWVAADAICQALVTVSLFAIFMRVASPAIAATQFTASMAVMNMATSLGAALAGPVSAVVGVPTAFLIAGLVQPLTGWLLLGHASAAADSPREGGDGRSPVR